MMCRICAITDRKVIDAVEFCLLERKGKYFKDDFTDLAKQFPQQASLLEKIDAQDCEIHFNFHQTIARKAKQEIPQQTLARDINKDEASVLYELLNTQSATFNALTHQINEAITSRERDMSSILVNPSTIDLYNQIGVSIRATARELRELNTAINGEKDPASEGLKALADALKPAKRDKEQPTSEMTTREFDD